MFIYSEKAFLLSGCTVDKSKVEILQNVVAFSEYTNFETCDITVYWFLKNFIRCWNLMKKKTFSRILSLFTFQVWLPNESNLRRKDQIPATAIAHISAIGSPVVSLK